MNVARIPTLMIGLGALVLAVGLVVYVTNAPERFDPVQGDGTLVGNIKAMQANAGAFDVADRNMRHQERRTQAGWEIAGGVVLLMAGITLHNGPKPEGDS